MKIVVFIIVILYFIMAFMGCNLFRKTTKNTSLNTESSVKQIASNQLIFKNSDKETQTFTYWTDSSIYQYQLIKEKSDEAVSVKLKTEEKQHDKQVLINKKSDSIKVWAYVVLIFIFSGCFVLYKKFRPSHLK